MKKLPNEDIILACSEEWMKQYHSARRDALQRGDKKAAEHLGTAAARCAALVNHIREGKECPKN